jgi:diguanylate cyclase (GGDEF)-like protein
MGGLVAAFVGGAIVAGASFAWRLRRRRDVLPVMSGVAKERVAGRTSPDRGMRASSITALRNALAPAEDIEARERELADDLRGYLGDVATQHGADDAMLWLRASEVAPFQSVAWNRPGAPSPAPWGSEQQRALVTWAAAEGIVSFDGAGQAPTVAASRVPLDSVPGLGAAGQAGGALVLHSSLGIQGSRDDLTLWLPRHAQRLRQLVELQVTRNEVARQNLRMRILVRHAEDLQATGDQRTLERGIAESVVEATGATFAALVAWSPEVRRGRVRHATKEYPSPVPSLEDPVEPHSLVGHVCLEGTPRRWEDARAIAGREALFSPTALAPATGTLAILPLHRATTVIGAMVIGASERGVIRPTDLRTVQLMAQLAASALEAAWEIEVVSRRSRTDQLTGLSNRRHFDEEQRRALDQTDRFGGTCALVIADLDHFKEVNDTYGHEAGDEVLKTFATVMLGVVRATDTCARIGGEELCVILPQTAVAGALELAERLRANLQASVVRWRGTEIRVTASFGVATYAAGAGAAVKGRVFEEADRALYRAKRDGRNCVRTE